MPTPFRLLFALVAALLPLRSPGAVTASPVPDAPLRPLPEHVGGRASTEEQITFAVKLSADHAVTLPAMAA